MPERRPRPIYATRHNGHDEPPATTDRPAWPARRRRTTRLQRPQDDSDHAPSASNDFTTTPQSRDAATSTQPRRRQRSGSPQDDIMILDTAFANERRRRYDDLRQRMAKRRRIDPDVLPMICPPIKYGYYGQVEPGRLKMAMISCDGGEHVDLRSPNIDLGPHNVLRTDKSVYCSAGKSASIILRHADATAFSLTQLSIVAPDHGFTAPVKEGVAYVAMSLADLTKYTDKVEGPTHEDAEPPSYAEAAHYSQSSPMAPLSEHTPDGPEHSHDITHPNNLTTLTDDTDLGPEDLSSQEVLDYRLQRMQQVQRRQDGLRWRDRRLHRSLPLTDDFSAFTTPAELQDGPSDGARPQYRYRPALPDHLASSTFEPAGVQECGAAQGRSQEEQERLVETGGLPSEDPAVNFAWFKVSEDTHKVTIKFNIPVSGRFILIKLGSAANAENVDVQSIVATGYAGPRFFPAIQPR